MLYESTLLLTYNLTFISVLISKVVLSTLKRKKNTCATIDTFETKITRRRQGVTSSLVSHAGHVWKSLSYMSLSVHIVAYKESSAGCAPRLKRAAQALINSARWYCAAKLLGNVSRLCIRYGSRWLSTY